MLPFLLVCAICGLLPVQSSQRNAARQPPSGTAELGGRVQTTGANPMPIRRAALRLSGGSIVRLAISDDDGWFSFTGLPAGRYTLTAAKAAFVLTYYGARQPHRGPGAPIALGGGERKLDLDVRMLRGGVIAGAVRDTSGRPVPSARVSVLEHTTVNGRRTARPVMTVQTDDRGDYRAYGLRPGDFIVAANQPELARIAARPTTAAEVQWAERQSAGAAGPGAAGSFAPPAPEQPVVPAPIYYPGTADQDAAATISLAPAEERDGIDILLQLVPAARVEGRVRHADGRPAPNAMLTLVRPTASALLDMIMMAPRSDAQGRFLLPPLSPGRYSLFVRASDPGPEAAAVASPTSPQPTSPDLWATQDLYIDGRDVSGLELVLRPGLAISGEVVFDGTGVDPPDPAQIRLNVAARDIDAQPRIGVPSRQVDADGTFVLRGLAPGTYQLVATAPGGANARWFARSAMAGGVDLLDRFELDPGVDLSKVVVTFTDRPAELTGTIQDSRGEPTSDFTLLVFPRDRGHWMYPSRRTRLVRPDTRGEFSVKGLPPGDYFVAALLDANDLDLGDAGLLDALAVASIPVTLAEGEQTRQDVRVASGG